MAHVNCPTSQVPVQVTNPPISGCVQLVCISYLNIHLIAAAAEAFHMHCHNDCAYVMVKTPCCAFHHSHTVAVVKHTRDV